VASARASVVVAAPRDNVWAVVGDPHRLPEWWPGVSRVEAVSERGFTAVMPTRSGRGMRLDFRLATEPESAVTWELELPGTPFERVLTQWMTNVRLTQDGPGTRVEIDERQELRGRLRLGALLQRRAARRRMREAAAGLRELF
jgi:carbon monoxide dehydrogenase subunit G